MVLRVIEANELPLPPDEIEEWPRPVRLRVLGDVSLERSSAPAADDNMKKPRSAKRPMELLLLLVTHGGSPVAMSTAMDALWPDAEGDAARKSLEITLHRLRRLLGSVESVRQDGGRLSLDTRHCWVDSIAFARLAEGAERGGTTDDDLLRVLAMYRGHFLGSGCDAPWALAYRERLRARYLRLVELAARRFFDSGQHLTAEDCYRRALELNPSAEVQYRCLMHSLAGRRDAEARGAADSGDQHFVSTPSDPSSARNRR